MRISQKNRHRKIVEDLERKLAYAKERVERLEEKLLEKTREEAEANKEQS